jgi:hypothetical protein
MVLPTQMNIIILIEARILHYMMNK